MRNTRKALNEAMTQSGNEYCTWCTVQGLPHESADEQTKLTPPQQRWVDNFQLLWQALENADSAMTAMSEVDFDYMPHHIDEQVYGVAEVLLPQMVIAYTGGGFNYIMVRGEECRQYTLVLQDEDIGGSPDSLLDKCHVTSHLLDPELGGDWGEEEFEYKFSGSTVQCLQYMATLNVRTHDEQVADLIELAGANGTRKPTAAEIGIY